MDLATGAMGTLLPKLAELLNEEYKLQKGVKEGVKSLEKEMQSMHAAIRKVARVPRDQLDEQVKLWAGEVRELSFDMEDVVDKFLVRVDDDTEPATKSNKLKRLTEKMAGLFTKGKARHEIADAIKEINKQVQEVASRRDRYNINNIVDKPAPVMTIDPRLQALYTEVTELVGIAGRRDQEVMKLLMDEGDGMSTKKLKTVSVVGFGGLGKTTLVKTVFDKIKGDYASNAFVTVGRNADAKKVFMDILLGLDKYGSQPTGLDERQLIDKLRKRLENKRYLIVIDDIWDKELWTIINLAFCSSNNFGSRLITTTRIVSVAKLCSSSTHDLVYQMTPLSDDDSKRLFYKRIFSHESECPHEFEKVSIDILKKCGGVPLAIITIASLLASDGKVKPEDEWHVLLESIGRGLKEDPNVEQMLKILSFSYYDLPSHLKTCLLYLSMFPEDCKIRKDQLIWMWIAESFVQPGKEKISLFEMGETYFNELVNRNMIQPVYFEFAVGQVDACRVHDMVLDLISSLSREENFVTILNGTADSMYSEQKYRRISLQYASKEELQTTPPKSVSVLQVRSIAAFKPGIDLMPPFSSFGVLRVLDLTGCNLGGHGNLHLRDLGSLLHLRYLGLAETGISELPEEIGKLQFLQMLDLRVYNIEGLPCSLIKLGKLMCLLLLPHNCKKFPDGFGNLSSLEVLSKIHGDSVSTVNELGRMVNLRNLDIEFDNVTLDLEEAFVESLGKLSNIQSIQIGTVHYNPISMHMLGERWVPARSLREFSTGGYIKFSTLPAWIKNNPSRMSHLSKLNIRVGDLKQEELESLGSLPSLDELSLFTHRPRLLVIRANGFHQLLYFKVFSETPSHIVFQPEAMPKVQMVDIYINLRVAKDEAAANGGDWFDPRMVNLSSLRDVEVKVTSSGVTVGEGKQAEAALKNSLRAHPNRPVSYVSMRPPIPQDVQDDNVYIV
ncbi:disease resistance protein RGA5-like [Lolium rigidum]|uniref:disease resistance protein RGA5-like n=1 Tax=Lolium rigidum TaxID=89674 RepID=UPI001F5D5D94|nr:disease resistance protein RGA5-like [Lolium rigidum]